MVEPASETVRTRDLDAHYRSVRTLSLNLTANLSDADATVQSMPDASPAKWHLAHTTWFFETFVLRDHVPGYRAFDDRYAFLFNSYYEAEGPRHARPARGMLTRPSLGDVIAYRAHVDRAMREAMPMLDPDAAALVTLGLHHEQQHQELLLTDLLHLFAQNPMQPGLWPRGPREIREAPPLEWQAGPQGAIQIGNDGTGSFAFDCEGPRHTVFLTPYVIASRPATNAEWLRFIEAGGYRDPQYWLSEGWDWVQREAVEAPLYWQQDMDGRWTRFTLSGREPVDPSQPVTHVSFYEADAFAAWSGARLPTEAEWEAMAARLDPTRGHFLDKAAPCHPRAVDPRERMAVNQMFGDVWEWTGSSYRPYPGFQRAEGAVGEYNGKFMASQFVLRGGSCATPRGHVRPSYRNFFYPHQRWQFAGVRLAKDMPQ